MVDLRPGLQFSKKVRSLLGASISASPSSGSSFCLLATFTRSKLKLTVEHVGFLLQSALGGSSDLFQVSELEDWIFKFCVSSKEVELLVYQLGIFQCDIFKVVFHLYNDRGIQFARSVLSSAQGISSEWTTVVSKKENLHGHLPLTGSNLIPIRSSSPGAYARYNHRGTIFVFNHLGKNWITQQHPPAKNTGPLRF